MTFWTFSLFKLWESDPPYWWVSSLEKLSPMQFPSIFWSKYILFNVWILCWLLCDVKLRKSRITATRHTWKATLKYFLSTLTSWKGLFLGFKKRIYFKISFETRKIPRSLDISIKLRRLSLALFSLLGIFWRDENARLRSIF